MESGNTSTNAIIPDENHVSLLVAMGFIDEAEVKRALRMAKNDVNEAVSLLTNEVPGLHDVDMSDLMPTTSGTRDESTNGRTPSSNPASVETTGANGDDMMDIDSGDGGYEGESESGARSLEFPATHLYNLEERVFTSQWNIPYKREESLGRCLIAATKLAKVGLADSDENCRRFIERCLPECFQKLLMSLQVNRWNGEIQDGIFTMLQLFIDLAAARLEFDPVPLKLMDILAVVFDPYSQYHQKNNRRVWDRARWETEFGDRSKTPAVPPSYSSSISTYDNMGGDSFGFLIDLINRLAVKGGLDTMAKKVGSGKLEAQELYALLHPLANCAEYLNENAVGPMMRSCCEVAAAYVRNLNAEDMRKTNVQNFVVDLLGLVRILQEFLLINHPEAVDELRLDFIHRLLRSSHFGSRMQALKELSKLLEYLNSSNKQEERMAISADRLSRWLSDQQILSLALEGNIDQAQYCDRLRTLLTFLGPRLSCQDIGKIWALRKGRTAVTVDNVHNIIAQAASKFSRNELEHLLTLIRNSWKAEGDRSKDKLLLLLGVIGRETNVSSTYEMVAEYLWEFAHQNGLTETLVTHALEEHLSIVSGSGRESCRTTFIQRCLTDMREGHFFLPAMGHLHAIVESVKKNTISSSKAQKSIIADLVNNKRLVETLCDCLVRIHAQAVKGWREKQQGYQTTQLQKTVVTPAKQGVFQTVLNVSTPTFVAPTNPPPIRQTPVQLQKIDEQQPVVQSSVALQQQEELGPDYVLSDGYTLGQYVDGVLAFLRFILNEGELFLLIHRCRELWNTLIADADACQYEREAGFTWFSRGLADLEKKCQQNLFEECMLAFDPQLLTPTGFECFRKYFESVNGISGGGSGTDKSRQYFSYSATTATSSLSTTGSGLAEIDKTDLLGLEYLWLTALNSADSDIARQAVDMVISVHYTCLASRLKKDPASLHKKFLNECYRRLEGAVLTFKSSPVANLLQEAGRLLAAPSFPALSQAPPPDRTVKVRNIERLLLIAEQYVKTVEAAQTTGAGVASRSMPAHEASFFGPSFVLRVSYEDTTAGTAAPPIKKDVKLLAHENETLGMLRERLADVVNVEYAKLALEHDGKELPHNQDQQILKRLGVTPASPNGLCLVRAPNQLQLSQAEAVADEPTVYLFAKRKYLAAFVASYDPLNKSSEVKSLTSGIFSTNSSRQAQTVGQESTLPAVMMAQDRSVFDMLHQLAQLDEPSVTSRVRELLLLIPSDSGVIESLDTLMASTTTNFVSSHTPTPVSSKTNSLERPGKSGAGGTSTSLSEKIGNILTPGSSSSPKLLRARDKEKDKDKESKAAGATPSGPSSGLPSASSWTSSEALKQLFDLTAGGNTLTPFRIHYNLEILSSRLLPTSYADAQTIQSAQTFAHAFVASQGVQCLLAVLRKDYLPFNVDPALRQEIYMTTLQLLCYLLCNESALHDILRSHVAYSSNAALAAGAATTGQLQAVLAAALVTATAPLESSASGTAAAAATSGAVAEAGGRLFDRLDPPQSCMARELNKDQMAKVLETLQRLSWAAAGGILHLIGTTELKSPQSGGIGSGSSAVSNAGAYFALGSPRSRTSESSTGSSDGTEAPSTLHGGVLSVHTSTTLDDVRIAKESLKLMVNCVLVRPEEFYQSFFNLPHLPEFILDLLLAADSIELRRWMERQLLRLAEASSSPLISLTVIEPSPMLHSGAPAVGSGGQESQFKRMILRGGVVQQQQQQHGNPINSLEDVHPQQRVTAATPRFMLLQILLKARVPLWVPSSQCRGSAHRLLLRCCEYFSLRGRLLSSLSAEELALIQQSPSTMLEDEARWLQNFSCSSDARLAPADNALLAGHMLLITSLLRLSTSASMKRRMGQCLIDPLLNDLLFPAARLIVSRGTTSGAANEELLRASTSSLRRTLAACGGDAKAKGPKTECRFVAYDLLLELCCGCPLNYADITRILTHLHHQYDPELVNEWDYSPLVDAKMDAGFVGLKNAGATCYMNSVLQQFFTEPGLVEQILMTEVDDNDSPAALFLELQRLMAHLRDSEQQYYVPQKFWEVFRLWGQQVNPREQQDAFEFYTCLIDQIDEFLKKSGKEELFRHKYQGIFSDQKICQGCPHSYERAEAFYALNLPVRAHGLEESLNNFVKGEILEGDNAYFCEKCGQKRTALKRMCIKTLPEVAVIQLKRFGYDWEENRALKFNEAFQFPLQLDLYPYTAAALSQMEGQRVQQPGTSNADDEDSHWYSLFATSPLAVIGGHHFRGHTPSPSGITGSSPGLPSSTSGRFTRRQSGVDKRVSISSGAESARYELVGIVVHSGQANAGHYYAFIKDRRESSVANGSAGKWFKFNDTTVEMVEMTPQFMEAELFGGKYTAKVEKNSLYPEERERYWNAYLLFYRRISDSQSGDSRLTRVASKRSVSMSSQCQFQTPTQSKSARRRDSLMELAELVEQGEQRQLFSSRYWPSGSSVGDFSTVPPNAGTSQQQQWWQPPAWLRSEIQEDNFRFSRNRDVYNPEYFAFIERLVDLAAASGVSSMERRITEYDEAAAEFALKFVLNTAWHCRRSLRGDPTFWANRIAHFTNNNPAVCRRLVDFFNQPGSCADDGGGKHYLSQFFFGCDNGDVRQAFGAILYHSLTGLCGWLSSDDCSIEEKQKDRLRCSVLLENLLSLTPKEAVERHQVSNAYFYLLRQLAMAGGAELCSVMLEKQAFTILLNFMLPAHGQGSAFLSRRWTLNQARELGDVYGTLAVLMMHCRFGRAEATEDSYYQPRHLHLGGHGPSMKAPPEMEQLIANAQFRSGFVRELVWASCHVHNVLPPLADLMMHCSWRKEAFSQRVVVELLVNVGQQPSNDLKHVFTLMEEFLCVDGDGLQTFRAETALDGLTSGVERVDGLLTIIKVSQASGDGKRSYNCIKFLVHAAEQCRVLKEALNKRLDRWQWAVDWLRSEMETMGGVGGGTAASTTSETSSFTSFDLSTPPRNVTASITVSATTNSGPTTAVSTVPISSTATPGTSTTMSYLTAGQSGERKSNEDSTTKNFQRTVSAQYTLDQAKALFGDIGGQQQLRDEEEERDGSADKEAANAAVGGGGGDKEDAGEKATAAGSSSGMNPGKKAGNSMFYIE